ncbi:MAG: SMP-30/gluconolactonase/LRE family protein [Verrucomicrobiota bacterium]|nr:SMP-30/gluconolactonase/LRE family protein [Verrucomicrobiota bacterium]
MELVGNVSSHLGEGPFWDSVSERLIWVDILGKKILEHDFENEVTMDRDVSGNPGCVVLADDETLVAAIDNGIFSINRSDWSVKILAEADPIPRLRFNDGKCDEKGRLWVGTMDREESDPVGTLYCCSAEGNLDPAHAEVTVSNGIAWSTNNEELYYIDSPTRCVCAFDFDLSSGQIKDKRELIKFTEHDGFPDGMTIDSEGRLWIAFWGGSKVLCIDPRSGKIEGKIDFPVSKITSCAFGGNDLSQLFVTSARVEINEEEEPLAGRVFVVEPGVTGLESNRYLF